nr:hypothetical protein HAGR004_28320 [Bdellovibrio sp. HAGR004]
MEIKKGAVTLPFLLLLQLTGRQALQLCRLEPSFSSAGLEPSFSSAGLEPNFSSAGLEPSFNSASDGQFID